jgi:PAS domain S-box-containing protein
MMLSPDLAEIAQARRFVGDVATEAGFAEARVFDITLVCSEAAANAIEHAPFKGQVEVKTLLYRDRLEVQIAGPGEFQTPDQLKERSHRGLGLPLMAKLSDHLALYSGPRGGTMVSLTFYLPGAKPLGNDQSLPPSVRELIESNELVSGITENAPVGMYVLGPDLRFRWANTAFRGFLDDAHHFADLTGRDYAEVVPGSEEAGLLDILRTVSQQGRPNVTEEFEFAGFQRGVTYWRWDAVPLTSQKEEAPYDVLAVISDVTEPVRQRARVEALAREVDHERCRLKTVLQTSPAAIVMVDSDGRLTYVNKRATELYGFDATGLDLPSHRARVRVLTPDGGSIPVEDRPMTQSLKYGRSIRNVEMKLEVEDGICVPVLVSTAPLLGPEGEILGAVAVFDDITERKRAEEAIREREERYRIVADFTYDWEHWRDPDGRFIYMSPSAERVTGYDRNEFVDDPDLFLRIIHPEDRERVRAHFTGPEPCVGIEYRLSARNGQERWIEHMCEVVTDSDGRVLGRRGSDRDITERKRAEERLRQEEQRASAGAYARSLIEAALDPLVTIGTDGKITDVNEATITITGRAREELVGTDFSDYFTDAEAARRGYQEVFKTGAVRDYPLTILHRDGRLTDVLYNASLFRDHEGNALGVFAAARDVSNLKELELQRDIAGKLQEALLDIPQKAAGVEFGHLYRSATEQAKVGGDFYDVFEAKEGRIALLMGDVSGHGLEAARIATLVKDVVHAFAHQFRRPQLVLRETNRLLVDKKPQGFVTAFLGFLDPGTGSLIYSSAGHPPPLILSKGRVSQLTSGSVPLGVFADARYRDVEVGIPKQARLLLYTDGLTEARRDDEFFGESRLAEALVRGRATPIEELPSVLLKEVLAFSGSGLRDDVALLAVHYDGTPPSTSRTRPSLRRSS